MHVIYLSTQMENNAKLCVQHLVIFTIFRNIV